MKDRPVTQRLIAKALGINHSTVCLALRNSSRVKQSTRELIQKTALEMGYHMNATASNLSKFRRHSKEYPVTAGLAWLNCWKDPKALCHFEEFKAYWDGAQSTAFRFGFNLEEYIVDGEADLPRIENILISRGIQGVLIPPHIQSVDFSQIDWNQFSVVRFGKSITIPSAHMVTSDQLANIMLAFQKISDRGYQRIGLVCGKIRNAVFTFDAGFFKAQSLRGSVEDGLVFRFDENDPLAELDRFKQWIHSMKVDAIISATRGLKTLLEASKLQIGNDIGVATMSVLDTRIEAGIFQNSREVGRVAVLSLISQIQDEDRGIPEVSRQTLVPGNWVDGDSLPNRSELGLDA